MNMSPIYPIYSPNGSVSLAEPAVPGPRLFTYDISSATWLSDERQSGMVDALGQMATAYDLGKEVLWLYGGTTDDRASSNEHKALWKAPGLAASDPDCVANSTESGDSLHSACQVNTTTADSPSAVRRPTRQATMVLIDVVGTSASTSAKSHFRIYPHNLHFNPHYPENARNSN